MIFVVIVLTGIGYGNGRVGERPDRESAGRFGETHDVMDLIQDGIERSLVIQHQINPISSKWHASQST
jgi:hypothetical protein